MQSQYIQGYAISDLVSPPGWGYENEVIHNSTTSFCVTSDFDTALHRCSAVWFVDDGEVKLPFDVLLSKVQKASSYNKKIIYTRKSKNEYDKLQLEFPECSIKENYNSNPEEEYKFDGCYDIGTTIIMVVGLMQGTDKLLAQLSLRNSFTKKGYKVSLVSSRNGAEIYGAHSLPHFMLDKTISVTDKIIRYNHYVKMIEIFEKPELIIIGVPGGAFPIDNIRHNDFGIFTFIISRAVPCDAGIMCLPYIQNIHEDTKHFENEMFEQYKIEIEGFHLAPIAEDIMDDVLFEQNKFFTLDRDFISNKLKSEMWYDFYNLYEEDSCDEFVDKIIEKLAY